MASPETRCGAKHTKYQPTDAEWKCPKCGGTNETIPNTFIIEDRAVESDDGCIRLHEADDLACGCGFVTSGKAFAARLQKAANMVPCPTCKGHGLVNGKTTMPKAGGR